ncbi:hypothetical protein NUW54_g4631 [Trametes sanguinea]|uniref:Uncharacterized protein n=1 Tax=Trametes sanguinea TaxID=158606 RepID=A0ACC1PYM6_9APHY|nr:hypothetical protein NUW54_g4631 [Trametes sanguinea]
MSKPRCRQIAPTRVPPIKPPPLACQQAHTLKCESDRSDALEEFLVKGGVYQPLSLQERADIVKAFGFSHRGHFYNCENGHTFVITECGGAMETARCPECRAPIGGSGHNLLSSNTRATEFEDLARRHGSADPHWPWARGA